MMLTADRRSDADAKQVEGPGVQLSKATFPSFSSRLELCGFGGHGQLCVI